MKTTQLSLDGIEELKLLDESGDEAAISSLWRERRAVLVFIRHFGWPIARRQVAELEGRADEFETAGLRLAVIGNGEPSHIAGFRKATGFSGEVYTDPDKKVYDALGFRRGMGSMVGLKSVKSLVGSVLSGHFSPVVQGDALQQGGVLIAGPGKTEGLVVRSREAGDYQGVEELLAAAGAGTFGADGGEESG